MIDELEGQTYDYDLTKDMTLLDMYKHIEKGINRNILVFDLHSEGNLTNRLCFLLQNVWDVNYELSNEHITTIYFPRNQYCEAYDKQNPFRDCVQVSAIKLRAIRELDSQLVKDKSGPALQYFKDLGGSLGSCHENLVVAFTNKDSCLLGSF